MIIDTSALVAVFAHEDGADTIGEVLLIEMGLIPAPIVVEFFRVVARKNWDMSAARSFLAELKSWGHRVEAFGESDAYIADQANERFGIGLGKGGTLNLLDLMTYAVAKRSGMAILCTGRDYSSTGIDIHPASRPH